MSNTKVTVYGLSTEGYKIACQMSINGADVFLIDEPTSSAILLKPEIAKTYSNISSLKEDEPLLSLVPIDVAISKSQYLFFTPKIRKIGQDVKTEIYSKFKNSISSLTKNSSIVYGIPTGFNGNSENILFLEHVTGFEVGKTISYYYYPLNDSNKNPNVIGSFNNKKDEKLSQLLAVGKKSKKFVSLTSSEYFHAINTLSQFTTLCSILEVCKLAQDNYVKNDMLSDEFKNLFLDDMVKGLYDLRSLKASFESATTLLYLINGGIKGIDNYVKRLSDEIRYTIKKSNLKASRTKVAISWTQDQHEIRGDKIEMLKHLTTNLRDYIGDVETYEDPNFDLFHTEHTTIIVACSKADFEKITKSKKNNDLIIIIKANSLCEIIQ